MLLAAAKPVTRRWSSPRHVDARDGHGIRNRCPRVRSCHLAERQRLRALYSGGGRGSNENSGDTLRALHAITYKCSECEGLIDHLAASRVAPTSLGCTGRGCSKNHRTPVYAVSQTRMAVALILGERGLVDRPERGQRVTVLYGRTRTLRVARAALDNALRHLCMSHTVHL